MRVRPYELLLVTSLIGLGDGSGQTNLTMEKSRSVLIVHDLCVDFVSTGPCIRLYKKKFTYIQSQCNHYCSIIKFISDYN